MQKLFNFLKEARGELKNVKWPSKKKTIRYTKAVIGFSLIVALFLGGLDYVFRMLLTKIL
jgi:preprotein translocase subunit SecE